MSHLRERKEKNCLNCQTEVVGRYCHRCGQENLEPKETVWHLVQHFFNDITHFDGKFFETVKYLLRRPGFLSMEYMKGRRMSYLNPIRMYVFTSAIFFIILFSLTKPGDMASGMAGRHVNRHIAQAIQDSLAKEGVTVTNRKKARALLEDDDDDGYGNLNIGAWSTEARTVERYDSAQQALPDSLRDGWFKRMVMRRSVAIRQEYHDDKRLFWEHLLENIFHSFPKILFVSLPIFALILNMLYFRHKQYYYVDHGIFTIHVYCATFMLLLAAILLQSLHGAIGWEWLKIILDIVIFALYVYMMIYLYKAMRGFYLQRRAKTLVKYVISFGLMSFINLILLTIFLLISVFSV